MKCSSVLALVVFFSCSLCPASFSAISSGNVVGLGAGLLAGMSGLSGEMLLHAPQGQFFTDNSFLRVSLALTDSGNLTPSSEWRRFMPLSLDVIYYFTDSGYVGAGLNFPLKVSDGLTGQPGGQYFVGADLKTEYFGRIYSELGYGSLNILNEKSFAGAYFMFGLRYDI